MKRVIRAGLESHPLKLADVKRMYSDPKWKFVTYDYGDGNGKVVIIVSYEMVAGELWRTVCHVIRLSDGKDLLLDGACRPCDNLDDAIDVAGEMF